MTPDDLETELLKLFSTIGGGAETLEWVRNETLECLEDIREEDALRRESSTEPFVNLFSFGAHTSGEPPFVLTAFKRGTVAFHVGSGLPETALEMVVQSERGEEDAIEAKVLRLASFSSTMTFSRALVEQWVTR